MSREMNYRARHKILGSAKNHPCDLRLDECRGSAAEWALDWRVVDAGNLRTSPTGLWFSVGMDDDYVPACRKCHKRFDSGMARRTTHDPIRTATQEP